MNRNSLVVDSSGSVMVTGDNGYSQLGVEKYDVELEQEYKPKDVKVVYNTVTKRNDIFVITDDGRVVKNHDEEIYEEELGVRREIKGATDVITMYHEGDTNIYVVTYPLTWYRVDPTGYSAVRTMGKSTDSSGGAGDLIGSATLDGTEFKIWENGDLTIEGYALPYVYPNITRVPIGSSNIPRTTILTGAIWIIQLGSSRILQGTRAYIMTKAGQLYGFGLPSHSTSDGNIWGIDLSFLGGNGIKTSKDHFTVTEKIVPISVPPFKTFTIDGGGGFGITHSGEPYMIGTSYYFSNTLEFYGIRKVPIIGKAVKFVKSDGAYLIHTSLGKLIMAGVNRNYSGGMPIDKEVYFGLNEVPVNGEVLDVFLYSASDRLRTPVLFIITEYSDGDSVESERLLYGCGGNYDGILGSYSAISPLRLFSLYRIEYETMNEKIFGFTSNGVSDITQLSTGYSHSLFLTSNGNVKSCGNASNGRLGYTPEDGWETHVANIIPNLSGVIKVSAGYNHSIFLMSDGTVKGCGSTYNGQLGFKSSNNQYDVLNIPIPSKAIDVIAGNEFTLILLENGDVLGAGYNYYKVLGSSGDYETIEFTKIEGLVDIVDMSSGKEHAIFIDSLGNGYGTGRSNRGQLGLESNVLVPTPLSIGTPIEHVICGSYHSLLQTKDNRMLGSGMNNNKQLGDSYSYDVKTFIDLGIGSVTQFTAGESHSAFVKGVNLLLCGDNYNGEVGLGEDATGSHALFTSNVSNIKNVWNWFRSKRIESISKLYAKVGDTWVKIKTCFGKKTDIWNKSNKLHGKREQMEGLDD